MNSSVCPLCKSQDSQYCFSERGYKLQACNNCELFYIDPYPNLEDVHGRVQTYNYDHLDILNPEHHYQASVQFQNRYFDLIAQELKGAKSILDIGCGTGHFLEKLGAAYPELYRAGIELNQERAAFAREKAGCDVFQVPVESFDPTASFDAITMLNVLSHIPDFDRLFGKLQTLLSPGGKLILKVGEMKKNVKEGDIFDWEIPDHLHFLGMNTIDYICKKFNFQILKQQRLPLSQEVFSAASFKAPGRSKVRNIVKKMLVSTPLALPTLAKLYDLRIGQRIYSSFIVLEKVS